MQTHRSSAENWNASRILMVKLHIFCWKRDGDLVYKLIYVCTPIHNGHSDNAVLITWLWCVISVKMNVIVKLAKMGLGMKEIVFDSDRNADHAHDTLLACCTKINTVNSRDYHFL